MDFKLYTTALKAYSTDNGDMYVSGTTSSTIRDLQGDEMTTDALKSMADTAKKNMTIWLNHNYNVPEDLFGSVTDARIVKRVDEASGEQVYDLDIDIKVCPEDENPEALRTYKAIKRGVRLGLSIGARVDQASKKKDKTTGLETYVIERISLLESSVVGIPANQRSYLQNALKSLRGASDRSDDTDVSIKFEEETMALGDFKVGDMVTWGSSGGPARGKITKIVREGSVKVPGSSFTINAEENDPAVLIRVYDGKKPTDTIVGHKMSTLRSAKSFDPSVEESAQAQSITTADGADPESLTGALYSANEAILSTIAGALQEGAGMNQQGVLNFLAERQEMHQKWSQQLRASLAPEEGEVSPVETPEVPKQPVEGSLGFKSEKENVHMDNAENLTAEAVEEVLPPTPPVEEPAEAPVVEPVVEEVAEVVEAEKALTLADRCGNVMAELESITVEEADSAKAQYLTHAYGWVKAYTEYAAEPAAPEEENPSAPAEEPGEAEEVENKPAAKSGTVDLAKVALDAAEAVRAEVETLKSALTVAAAEKAKVEADFERAVALLEKAVAIPVGRKSGYQPSSKTASKAVWLEPYVQRLLDANEE
jgi:HK97 family phage prohead protease